MTRGSRTSAAWKRAGSQFGNGVQIEVLNEGGGREIILFNDLSAQFAYLLCVMRDRDRLTRKLAQLSSAAAARARADRGRIGCHAVVRSVPEIIDVCLGDHAQVSAALCLHNGTVLSCADAPVTIGPGVVARDFIVAEGSQVTDGAQLFRTFIGQGCRIGRQFFAENSAFFANCEGFLGEACSVFAGPYTVTHHKSTLLIAGMFSFYNAGSGTNFSNHRYKLGPRHEGKLERGTKTGSLSYLMWPCRVGPFSIVLGKHGRVFDAGDLPFSVIEADPAGRSRLTPAINLTTVGTVRDGAKWPTRDRRHPAHRRDRIVFEVLNPLTVGRMLRGLALLAERQQHAEKFVDAVGVNGVEIKRVLLRTGQKYYRRGIHLYLTEQIVLRLERALAVPATSLRAALAVSESAVYSEDWLDAAGQLLPAERLRQLCADVEADRFEDVAGLEASLSEILAAYTHDEWAWVRQTYAGFREFDWETAGPAQLASIVSEWAEAKQDYLELVLADAQKEFDAQSQAGYGFDRTPATAAADFAAVHGNYDENAFVRGLRREIDALPERAAQLRDLLQRR